MSCWYPSFLTVIHAMGIFDYWQGWWQPIAQFAFCF